MAFKAVIHYSASPEHMQEIQKTIAQFRAEKAAKYLEVMRITYDTICECFQQEKIQKANSNKLKRASEAI
jgi:hypothetical protein